MWGCSGQHACTRALKGRPVMPQQTFAKITPCVQPAALHLQDVCSLLPADAEQQSHSSLAVWVTTVAPQHTQTARRHASPDAGAMSTMLLDLAAQGTRSPDQPTATEMSPTCRLLPRSRLLNSLTCQAHELQRLLQLASPCLLCTPGLAILCPAESCRDTSRTTMQLPAEEH